MKKLVSAALALALTLSMSTVAFAAPINYTKTAAFSFNDEIKKTYVSEGDVVVNETLNFTSEALSTNPDTTKNLTVDSLDVATSSDAGYIKVNVPELEQAGTYEWVIKETAGNTAGVTYTNDEIHVVVLVEYDNDYNKLKISDQHSFIKGTKSEGSNEIVKKDTFENSFNSGKFSVAKNVKGNMADKNDKFEIKVTLEQPENQVIGTNIKVGGVEVKPEAWVGGKYETTLTLSEADGATTFDDIPVGVKVTVAEDQTDSKMNGYTYVSGDGNLTVADNSNVSFVVLNEKTTTVDTGINLDSMPYVLLLVVAGAGLAVFFFKKRMMHEN